MADPVDARIVLAEGPETFFCRTAMRREIGFFASFIPADRPVDPRRRLSPGRDVVALPDAIRVGSAPCRTSYALKFCEELPQLKTRTFIASSMVRSSCRGGVNDSAALQMSLAFEPYRSPDDQVGALLGDDSYRPGLSGPRRSSLHRASGNLRLPPADRAYPCSKC
jgi:hypothetical protein